jgi:ParB-like chromosome segregation protein Spo0J
MASQKRPPRQLGDIQLLPVESIHPSPDNPRVITPRAVELVAKSLQRFGWQQPLVLDAEHTVIAGHTRLMAAKSLGLSSVPAVIASGLTPDEVRAYRIADNRTGDFTSWDFPELAAQLDSLAAEFAEELALADISALTAGLDAAEENNQVPVPDGEQAAVDVNSEIRRIVIFSSEAAAVSAALLIADLDGVVDVRTPKSTS